jgi:hypothetical protein
MKSKASCLSKIGMDTIWIFPTGKSGIFYFLDKMATRSKKKTVRISGKKIQQ